MGLGVFMDRMGGVNYVCFVSLSCCLLSVLSLCDSCAKFLLWVLLLPPVSFRHRVSDPSVIGGPEVKLWGQKMLQELSSAVFDDIVSVSSFNFARVIRIQYPTRHTMVFLMDIPSQILIQRESVSSDEILA